MRPEKDERIKVSIWLALLPFALSNVLGLSAIDDLTRDVFLRHLPGDPEFRFSFHVS